MKMYFFGVYEKCIKYLRAWTESFEEFEHYSWMQMKKASLKWESITQTMSYLKDKHVHIDENILFNKFYNMKKFVEMKDDDEEFKKMMMNDRWNLYLNSNDQINQELSKIAQFYFCIPAHNANVERIFSLIDAQWTDDRNRLSVESIKGLALTQYNFKAYNCEEFFDYILAKPKVLEDIRSNDKYN